MFKCKHSEYSKKKESVFHDMLPGPLFKVYFLMSFKLFIYSFFFYLGKKARTFDFTAMFEQTRRTAVERSRKILGGICYTKNILLYFVLSGSITMKTKSLSFFI
uniref:Uncharacterized protein n=1 Tax=Laticauda laticaudata TaxID=8630 RepID=A0A8C5SHQ1_LATLA